MTPNDTPPPDAALEHYDLDPLLAIAPAGGTAGRTWRVSTRDRAYFLRMRGVRTSTQERLVYDHGLREHLSHRGVPTAVAFPTRDGQRWLTLEGRVFELYPFVEGTAFDFSSHDELEAAAEGLARFHEAARDYEPREDHPLVIAQYAWLGFCDRASDRMDDPQLQIANIEAILNTSTTPGEQSAAHWALERARRLAQTNAGERYQRLLGWVAHGDYTPANLLFTDQGQLAGIFDLDWAMPTPRCRDIGDALFFFAGDRETVDSSNIWALTDASPFDFDRCVAFLRAYDQTSPLSAQEWDAIPSAFEGRWLSIRLEGMAKVPESERLRFFGRGDLQVPPEWLDEHWGDVYKAALAP